MCVSVCVLGGGGGILGKRGAVQEIWGGWQGWVGQSLAVLMRSGVWNCRMLGNLRVFFFFWGGGYMEPGKGGGEGESLAVLRRSGVWNCRMPGTFEGVSFQGW